MAKRTIVIGTGFLGRAVVHALRRSGSRPKHTFRQHRVFPDSIRFDLLKQTLPEVVSLSGVGTLIIAAKVEHICDSAGVVAAMQSLLRFCRDMRIVYLSSDAVFDGRKGMYLESDSRNPMTLYGRNKKACEDMLMAEAGDICIVRPSYIYGYSGGQLDPRLALARKALREGTPFGRYVDMYKSPIEVNQLAQVIVWASRSSFKGVLHVGGDRISVFDFVRKALTGMGEDPTRLIPERIPSNAPPELLADTSLDCSLLAQVFNEKPVRVEDAFPGCIRSMNDS
ncbi:sugar nucleotide-binding protein [Sulfuritalea sp.]|uniref:sugar nucleotide-binding protein n=1 Tax=Sulfuritalea sp. TaxID=2480090 RepID=UPI001AC4155C|nr:sugar nucleotide-binding protein [Sulfuritalea sp.]MBN8474884.1 sugar nucleotide-binding protein [Sulfuritalea sp.]